MSSGRFAVLLLGLLVTAIASAIAYDISKRKRLSIKPYYLAIMTAAVCLVLFEVVVVLLFKFDLYPD